MEFDEPWAREGAKPPEGDEPAAAAADAAALRRSVRSRVNGEHTRERRVKQLAAGGDVGRGGVGELLDPSLRVRLRPGQGGCAGGARARATPATRDRSV